MNEQAARELIREIACEHGVAIDRDDPILLFQTASRRILLDAAQEVQLSVDEALARHRSELELAAVKWHADSQRTASELLQHAPASIASTISSELQRAASMAVLKLQRTIERHEKAMAAAVLTYALAAAFVMLAAATCVWVSARAAERGNRCEQSPAATPHEASVEPSGTADLGSRGE